VVVVPLERRRFVPRCDFVSSAGFAAPGQPRRGAPSRLEEIAVVTDRCILRATRDRPRLRVTEILPGNDPDVVRAGIGFDFVFDADLRRVPPPEASLLEILRRDVDPARRHVGPLPEPQGDCSDIVPARAHPQEARP
jgi:hypothetical protein